MKIILDSGIQIVLYELVQNLTYEGLIEGIPTKEMNARHIEFFIKKHSSSVKQPYLIEPVESPINIGRDYPLGEPAKIPEITCVASFESNYTEQQESILYRSIAKIIWFQEEFALPIERSIIDQIKSIDWPMISTEYEI